MIHLSVSYTKYHQPKWDIRTQTLELEHISGPIVIVATFSMNFKMGIGSRSNDQNFDFSFSFKPLSIVCDTSHVHCDSIKTYHSFDTVGATPFVDSGWPHLLKWAQKLQSEWLTHNVDQQTCWCVWMNPTVQFVVSLVLRVTICWFGSIIETTFCTADPFCWQRGVKLSPFVDSGLSSNQHSVRWTHFVDTTMFVIIREKSGQQKDKLKPDKVNFLADYFSTKWNISVEYFLGKYPI